ncbi:hypothetical protein GWK48_11140 [Metallosphaera tengchongensis]|uniref:Uncharacterized protein n=1 Tax=Metallosphaera tengchongensis TaxID=1532350 RepID=A0A6N0NVF3_9CREN|nr:hypothetical protein [Metallosphaera tengchongensis]QKR00864.1 hypothetical protein GWK48_11140 [Metallosphaera tengchongensis]
MGKMVITQDLPVEVTFNSSNSNTTFTSDNAVEVPSISYSQYRYAKVEEYGKAGLAVEFSGEYYTVESHDALVLIYRDRQGKICTIDIEFEDDSDEPKP